MKITDIAALERLQEEGLASYLPDDRIRVTVGMDTCGIGNGAEDLLAALSTALRARRIPAVLVRTGCFGFCAEEPFVTVRIPGKPLVILHRVTVHDVPAIVRALARQDIPHALALCKIETWDHLTAEVVFGSDYPDIPLWNEIPFFTGQKKIVLRDSGLINPEDIKEYIAIGGYRALYKVLHEMSPETVIEEVKRSKLRGRGGAGFPTGKKWELMRRVPGEEKYVICNGDEGDPGAYMNRNESESDPHMVLEGMIIGAYAMGARHGVLYIRAEYPLAVKRLRHAIAEARACGILGEHIFGSPFSFDIDIVEGAGAFVCGEETALIASIEGLAGRPKPRPPFPAECGYKGKPTNINNVETWCNIPAIITKGGEWFAQTGTQNSAGTKVFSLVGKIKNTGLVELPLGTTLQTIIYGIGEGTGTRKRVKAVQTGGPSGGCIPASLFTTPVDYESLNALGAIMGSGGMVVMDDDNCMVDVAKYFTEFTTSESCGKCVPCREGLYQALRILKDVTAGTATEDQLRTLKTLGDVIKDTALCGLGQTGPNPVLTTLNYFRHEYDEHVRAHRCDAGVCPALFLSPCENSCPLHMNIPGFLTLFKEEKVVDAFDAIIRDNPFPASSGRICHFHCKMRCRREDIDDPVSQGEVHRYIADTVYAAHQERAVITRLAREKCAPTKKKIAIIGAGPAGLTAAFYLIRLGHAVDIYEAKAEAGGVLRYGIPQYRLPKDVLAKEVSFIKHLGVRFIMHTVVDAARFSRIEHEYNAIFWASGAYKNMALDIPGEHLRGVISGTAFLEDTLTTKRMHIGKSVIVIGAGNVAIDAARTALRAGARVTIVYRREENDMPANKDEIKEARVEGINFVFMRAPQEILDDGTGAVRGVRFEKMRPGDFDASGRRRPVPTGETSDMACDMVMRAIGERVDANLLESIGFTLTRRGTIAVDAVTLATARPHVWAGGDVVMGPSTAVEAMAQGKTAALAIDRTLMGEDRSQYLAKKFEYAMTVPLEPSSGKKQPSAKLPLSKRLHNFKEVSLGLKKKQAIIEAMRCLRCDVKEAPPVSGDRKDT